MSSAGGKGFKAARAGGLLGARASIAAGIMILVLLVVFVIYSVAFKQWCEQHQNAWGGQGWGQEQFGGKLGECIKTRSIFSF